MSVVKDLIDALAEDLDNSDLPDHGTVRYRRPRVINGKDCSLLVIWLQTKQPRPETTELFDSLVTIGVSWHEKTVKEVETLKNNDDISAALIDALETIEARIRIASRDGLGVDNVYEILPGDSLYLPSGMQQGISEGYAIEVLARVTEV